MQSSCRGLCSWMLQTVHSRAGIAQAVNARLAARRKRTDVVQNHALPKHIYACKLTVTVNNVQSH